MKPIYLLALLRFAVVVLITLTAAGCGRPSSPPRAVLPDRYYVAEAALHYMFDKFSGSGNERNPYSAYVLESGEFTPQLLTAFASHKPAVTTNIQFSTDGGIAHDKATGKPVQLWKVKVEAIQGDSAVAHVSWYSADEAAGGHTIHLKRKAGKWIVVSEKMDWVS